MRVPLEPQFVGRRHIADERRSGHDRGARQLALATYAHPVLPVAIERRDRALPFFQRVGTLAEARPAPRFTNLPADRAEDFADRFPAETGVGPLDLARHASGA